jgi:iron complex outermembrane receptor protein
LYETCPNLELTIFTDSIIKRYENQDVSKFLTIEKGIYVKTYGLGGIATISKRGASSNQTQLLWNNIPINSPTLGLQDLSLLPIIFTDVVSVNNGTASNGGIEGSVNFGNYQSFDTILKVDYTKEIGSFGLNKTSVKAKYGNNKWQASSVFFHHKAINDFLFEDYSQQTKPIINRTNAQVMGWGASQNVYRNWKNMDAKLVTNYVNYNRKIPSAIGTLNSVAYQLDQSFKSALNLQWFKKNIHQLQLGFLNDQLNFIDTISTIYSSVQTQLSSLNYTFRNFKILKKWYGTFHADWFNYAAQSSGFSEKRTQNRMHGNFSILNENKFLLSKMTHCI